MSWGSDLIRLSSQGLRLQRLLVQSARAGNPDPWWSRALTGQLEAVNRALDDLGRRDDGEQFDSERQRLRAVALSEQIDAAVAETQELYDRQQGGPRA